MEKNLEGNIFHAMTTGDVVRTQRLDADTLDYVFAETETRLLPTWNYDSSKKENVLTYLTRDAREKLREKNPRAIAFADIRYAITKTDGDIGNHDYHHCLITATAIISRRGNND